MSYKKDRREEHEVHSESITADFSNCPPTGSGRRVVDPRCRARAHRRLRCRRTCVGAFVGGALEEVVLQRVIGRDPRLRVEVEHPHDQVLELEVVGDGVAGLTQPTAAWAARLDAEDVVQPPCSGALGEVWLVRGRLRYLSICRSSFSLGHHEFVD